jgi:hypothetical protein
VLQVVQRVITRFLLKQAGVKADEADSGALTLIQRFGSAANLNIHLHRRAHLRGDRRYGRPEHSQPSSIEWPGATGSVLGASGRGHRRSSAMVDHKNRHPSQDCRARLPYRHMKRGF